MARPNTIETERALAKLEDETLDALAGTDDGIPEDEAPNTYSGIAALQRKQEAAQRALKPGLEPETVLTAGAVPKMTGGPWATTDHFGTEPALGFDVNGPDPSGSQRFRGPG
jgi:hypothetical protein